MLVILSFSFFKILLNLRVSGAQHFYLSQMLQTNKLECLPLANILGLAYYNE